MLKPADTEIVVLKGPLPTPLHLSSAVGHPPTVRAVTGLSACAGLGGKHSQIVYTGVACSPAPGKKPSGHVSTNSGRYIGLQPCQTERDFRVEVNSLSVDVLDDGPCNIFFKNNMEH